MCDVVFNDRCVSEILSERSGECCIADNSDVYNDTVDATIDASFEIQDESVVSYVNNIITSRRADAYIRMQLSIDTSSARRLNMRVYPGCLVGVAYNVIDVIHQNPACTLVDISEASTPSTSSGGSDLRSRTVAGSLATVAISLVVLIIGTYLTRVAKLRRIIDQFLESGKRMVMDSVNSPFMGFNLNTYQDMLHHEVGMTETSSLNLHAVDYDGQASGLHGIVGVDIDMDASLQPCPGIDEEFLGQPCPGIDEEFLGQPCNGKRTSILWELSTEQLEQGETWTSNPVMVDTPQEGLTVDTCQVLQHKTLTVDTKAVFECANPAYCGELQSDTAGSAKVGAAEVHTGSSFECDNPAYRKDFQSDTAGSAKVGAAEVHTETSFECDNPAYRKDFQSDTAGPVESAAVRTVEVGNRASLVWEAEAIVEQDRKLRPMATTRWVDNEYHEELQREHSRGVVNGWSMPSEREGEEDTRWALNPVHRGTIASGDDVIISSDLLIGNGNRIETFKLVDTLVAHDDGKQEIRWSANPLNRDAGERESEGSCVHNPMIDTSNMDGHGQSIRVANVRRESIDDNHITRFVTNLLRVVNRERRL